MAGTLQLIDTVTALAATTTKVVSGAAVGGHNSASFFVVVSVVTGTWSISPQFAIGSEKIVVADFCSISSTGLNVIDIAADFAVSKDAIPSINEVLWTEDSSGAITAKVYVLYGD